MSKETLPAITGLGKAEPINRITNQVIADMLGRRVQALDRIARVTGVKERGWLEREKATSDLAYDALMNALTMRGIRGEDLTAGITVATMSEDFNAVPVASMLQERVGAPNFAKYHDVGGACAGFLLALHEAYMNADSDFGLKGPKAVIGAEVISRSIDPSHVNTFILFGDGAGAAIVENVQDTSNLRRHIGFSYGAEGKYAENLMVPAGGSKIPASRETIEDSSKPHCIYMDGDLVEKNAIERMAQSTVEAMEKAGVTINDVSLFVYHQANLAIIRAVGNKLNIPGERVYVNIHRVGNTSAASVPIALTDANSEGKLKPGEIIVAAAFGGGFTWGAVAIPWIGISGTRDRVAA